ncbi:MAG TPA: serine/threonine-protein kinase, partial [Polyangia bacterium]|nr:serine/threonine-protein kinase [Polyangia bacterium]
LKPDNIFLGNRNGQTDFVKLLDFGLAKTVNIDLSTLQNPALATLDGSFVGTPAYVSPEQASGKEVDHRTDIYSVGVVLYELVCGRLPFAGDSIGELLVNHLTSPPPPLPREILSTKLGRTLDAIIHRCLDKDPEARFSSAAQLAEIFGRLGRGEPVQFTATDTYLGARRSRHMAVRRTAARLGLGLGVGLALSLLTGILVARLNKGGAKPAVESVAGAGSGTRSAATAPDRGDRSAAGALGPSEAVTVVFESDPPGAEARIVGATAPLGVTPFQRQFPRSPAPLDVELTLAGYESARVTTTAGVSRTLNVKLTKTSAAFPRRTRPTIDKETTIDPFR